MAATTTTAQLVQIRDKLLTAINKLAEEGVKLREYKNQPQRKFVTKFSGFPVLDSEGEQIAKYIPYGSRVRVMWEPGKPHPQHGVSPYFKKIKVLEMAEGMAGADDEDF